jgi:hypothetical protein
MDSSMTCLRDDALIIQQSQRKHPPRKATPTINLTKKASSKKASIQQYLKNDFLYQAVEMPSCSRPVFARAKVTHKLNMLDGTMLEVKDDSETREIFLANKTKDIIKVPSVCICTDIPQAASFHLSNFSLMVSVVSPDECHFCDLKRASDRFLFDLYFAQYSSHIHTIGTVMYTLHVAAVHSDIVTVNICMTQDDDVKAKATYLKNGEKAWLIISCHRLQCVILQNTNTSGTSNVRLSSASSERYCALFVPTLFFI